MAILNNLIVNGAARFLNLAYFNRIQADILGANEGYFNFIKTVDGEVTNKLSVNDLSTVTARVVESLTVDGEIHSNNWTVSNIAAVDGNFMLTPTVSNTTALLAINIISTTGGVNTYKLTLGCQSGSSFAVVQVPNAAGTGKKNWPIGSKVLVTGDVTIGNMTYPLGTCQGVLYTALNATGCEVVGVQSKGLDVLISEVGAFSGKNANIKISIYQTAPDSGVTASNNTVTVSNAALYRPIGILLTAKGTSANSTFIDIYGGVNDMSHSTTVLSAQAEPNVRIGNLEGLPNIISNDQTNNEFLPTGWGIYTDNGFFKGTIVSTSGRIGSFILDTALHAGTNGGPTSISGTTAGTYVGTDGFLNYNSGTQYVKITGGVITAVGAIIRGQIEALSGKIGNASDAINQINIGTNTTNASIYTGGHTSLAATGNGFYLGTDGLSIGNGFSVTSAGVLNATNAVLKGLTIKDSNNKKRLDVDATNGINIYNSSEVLTSRFNGSSVIFYDGGGTAASNITAQFSSSGATIGKSGIGYIDIKSTGIDFCSGSNNNNLAHIGYELTNIDSRGNIDMAPCITFGSRDYRNVSFDEFDDAIFEEPTDYDSTVEYHAGTIVKYNNIFYISTYNSTGIIPSSSATYWRRIIGANSFVQGRDCIASGTHSNAKGYATRAIGDVSTAEGDFSVALGDQSHAEGRRALASGQLSHAEGSRTIASGTYSHTEGRQTEASGNFTHAEGYKTVSSSIDSSHAEGWESIASGRYGSHAEGSNTIASGSSAHAEGSNTIASGSSAHAQNFYTVATEACQTVIGKYNAATVTGSGDTATYTNVGNYAFIIGNGTANTTTGRSNALTVDWNGNVNIASGAKYKINGVNLSASDVGAVPTSRTINGKALSSNISLTASDVGAVPTNGNSTTCSYPAGFASRTTGATWGNTIGTSFTSWNDSTGGSIDFRQDNPSSGKVSLKVDGRFYFNEGNTPTAGLTSTNGYWGLTDPDGNTNTNTWIRTTQAGLIPYQSGGRGSGHCFLGTDSWYFQHGYIDNIHGVTLDFSGTATIGGITRINNSLYCDVFYTGSGVVNGNMSVAGTLYQSSDRRLKKHLNYLGKDAVQFIQNLRPVHYIKDDKQHVGFYAQDVKNIDIWGGMTDKIDDYYTLNYSEIIAPLVTYCHYLEERIKKLEER